MISLPLLPVVKSKGRPLSLFQKQKFEKTTDRLMCYHKLSPKASYFYDFINIIGLFYKVKVINIEIKDFALEGSG
jgi:hypothetical protein